MSKILIAIFAIVAIIAVSLIVLDIIVLVKRKNKTLTMTKAGRYFNDNLLRFNSFVILALFCFFWIIPLVIGVCGSLTSQYAFTYEPGHIIPKDGFTFANYVALFNQKNFDGTYYPVGKWLLNSFIVSSVSTILYLIIAGAAAYALVFLKFKFRNVLFGFMLITMVIPGIATMTAQLANVANLRIAKTLWALILPGLGGVGGMYLIRQFYLGIPKDLIESARIDGSSDFRIFFRIVLPLAKSVFLVQGLFCFMGSWNDLMWPQIILGATDMDKWTLQMGVAYISGARNANVMGLSLASAMFSAIPIMILFIITQNKIIDGVAYSGVKG